ncbi:hypothetical protein AB0C93_31240 [Streptomyces sp. NPDC048518]|uniref:hypothetical protein n=1 Tax=Streptomyces sp. NPDC048518 TaxID=3155029 RepID=UPI0033C84F57
MTGSVHVSILTFPDAERLVVDFLKNRAELTGSVVDNKPPAGFDGTQKAVLVSRVGGAWVDDRHLDQPLLDLEVYGPDKSTAHGISLAARACVLELTGTSYGGAVVTDVAEADGPRWLPDYNRPAGNRYLSTVRISIRPE